MTSHACSAMDTLSDDLLASVFAIIDVRVRQHTLVRVCRRWANVAVSPALLHELSITVDEGYADEQGPKFFAFWAWFAARAAAHTRQLVFSYQPPWHSPAAAHLPPVLPAVLEAAMRVALAAPTLTQLTQLQLRMGGSFTVRSALAALPALRMLRCLCLSSQESEGDRDALSLLAPLVRLSALEELVLQGSAVRLGPTASLPPGITHLSLDCYSLRVARRSVGWGARFLLCCFDKLGAWGDHAASCGCNFASSGAC